MTLHGLLYSRITPFLLHRFLLVTLPHPMIFLSRHSCLPGFCSGGRMASPMLPGEFVLPSLPLHWPTIFKTFYIVKFHRLLRLLFSFPKRTRANTLTIIDRSDYQIPVTVSLTGRLIPYSVKHSLESYIRLRRSLTFFVSLKAIILLFTTFWTPRKQSIVSFYLISLKHLNASTLTG